MEVLYWKHRELLTHKDAQTTMTALSSCLANRKDTEIPWNNGLGNQTCAKCRFFNQQLL